MTTAQHEKKCNNLMKGYMDASTFLSSFLSAFISALEKLIENTTSAKLSIFEEQKEKKEVIGFQSELNFPEIISEVDLLKLDDEFDTIKEETIKTSFISRECFKTACLSHKNQLNNNIAFNIIHYSSANLNNIERCYDEESCQPSKYRNNSEGPTKYPAYFEN
ncbi:hypothetical protein C1645_834271 [Glomus cerebriforme]|uniref:Uncharacterized protein n=1 Tax=Glomus cerebriforme TaxID=658196 RepID=A0A397S9W4_9GLOM|nr:hypothetical protein C1645_834271 [Glomus cerebriforme]